MATVDESTPTKRGRRVPEISPPASPRATAPVVEEDDDTSADAAVDASGVRWFRVLRPSDGRTFYEVPYGGSKVRMNVGKVLSSQNYNVDDLRYAGVDLEEVPQPGWYNRLLEKEAQAKAAATRRR